MMAVRQSRDAQARRVEDFGPAGMKDWFHERAALGDSAAMLAYSLMELSASTIFIGRGLGHIGSSIESLTKQVEESAKIIAAAIEADR